MRSLLLVVMGSLVAVLPGCAGGNDEEMSAEAQADLITQTRITDADDGKAFTVEIGKTVALSLSSNGSTGYKWTVVSTTKAFGYPTPREGSFQESTGPHVGRGGKQNFVWKLDSPELEPGKTMHVVKLEYRRPFEPASTPAEKKFSFRVKIKAADQAEPVVPDSDYACPEASSINCMPPRRGDRVFLCSGDYRDWAKQNCDVSYLD